MEETFLSLTLHQPWEGKPSPKASKKNLPKHSLLGPRVFSPPKALGKAIPNRSIKVVME